MNNEDLFYQLLKSESEKDVLKALKSAGYWEEEFDQENSNWTLLGGRSNNYSTINNQSSNATSAIVEKLINSMDAMLISKCIENGIDPRSKEAPKNMSEAVEKFFGVKDGRLENLDSSEQTTMAQNIQFIATGAKGKDRKNEPCYMIVDKGEGQTPEKMHDTILSIEKENKKAINFVQGQFNQGGTAAIQFCGNEENGFNMQLIASKRNPNILKTGESNDWSFTIIRRVESEKIKKASKYSEFIYLAPKNNLLTFKGSLKALPDSSQNYKPYVEDLEFGTLIKLYEYQWDKMGSTVIRDQYRAVNKKLLTSPLPVKFIESRDYAADHNSVTFVGLWNRKQDEMEEGFPISGKIDLTKENIGVIPWKCTVYKKGTNQREIESGVFLTINGQEHGNLGPTFVQNHLKFAHLQGFLIIDLDFNSINKRKKEDLISSSRDRLRKNSTYKLITESVKEAFAEHPKLKELNNIRKTSNQLEKLNKEGNYDQILNELVKKDKEFFNVLTGLANFDAKTIRKFIPESDYAGKKFPTFFHFSKNKKTEYEHKSPINKNPRISLKTDVMNDYFYRSANNSPGTIKFTPNELTPSYELVDGDLNLVLHYPKKAKAGDEYNLKIEIHDDNPDTVKFENNLKLIALKELKSNGSKTKKKKQKKDPEGNETNPVSGLPTPIEYSHKSDAENAAPEDWGWNEYTSLEFRAGDWYVNEDNIYLENENASPGANILLNKDWFKIGLLIQGLSIKNKLETENLDIDRQTDILNYTLPGLGFAIIPILKNLPNINIDA